jgi:hypothetical protein
MSSLEVWRSFSNGTARHGPFFEDIFFEKFEKPLLFFKKFEKVRKKIASQINELSEDVSVSNGVLILKKGCLYNVTNLDRFCQQLNIKNQILNSLMVLSFITLF